MNKLALALTNYVKSLLAFLSILLIALGYIGYQYITLGNAYEKAKEDFSKVTSGYEKELIELKSILSELKQEKGNLEDELSTEKGKNKVFEDQIEDISKTVGTLDKLAKTDEELLKKYSKIYFLNEHYVPGDLSIIDSQYILTTEKNLQIHTKVLPHLEDLLEDAQRDNVDLKVVSAYRSYGTQEALKSSYNVTYGAGTANQFSADQGYSEHQLGTTIDFSTAEMGGSLDGFEHTEAYTWLGENAHHYGFVLSYPPDNTYYQYEPWHWRFVGEDLAEDLYKDKKYFYDIDQREIDAYLVDLFD